MQIIVKKFPERYYESLYGFKLDTPVEVMIDERPTHGGDGWYLVRTFTEIEGVHNSDYLYESGRYIRPYVSPQWKGFKKKDNVMWIEYKYCEIYISTNQSAKYLLVEEEDLCT